MYRTCIKRLLSIVLSVVLLVLFWWLFVLLALLVKCTSKGPVFFKQERIGAGKRHFMMYKFRTMRTDTPKDVPTHLLKGAESYITPLGKFLRASSLDELPQLFNILKGDMAFIGPRPALYNQYDLIAERDKYGANDVRPGLTGLAQVNGRDELAIPIKASLDGKYVKHITFFNDLRIFGKTIGKVISHDGVVEGEQ